MALQIQKLTKTKINLRMAINSPTGAGKTFTALALALALTDGKILILDSERSSADRYADIFNSDGRIDRINLPDFNPDTYIEGLELAAKESYALVIVDSLSHAWMGKEGALEQVDKFAKKNGNNGSSFNAWREVTPMHNRLVDALLTFPGHLIVTMRVKTEYIVETNDKGKSAPRKVGLSPVQRDGIEYEFDIVADMDQDNNMIITKTRMAALGGKVIPKPGAKLAVQIREWLESGTSDAVQVVKDPCLLDSVGKVFPKDKSDGVASYMRLCRFTRDQFDDLKLACKSLEAGAIDERWVILEGQRLKLEDPAAIIRLIEPKYGQREEEFDPYAEERFAEDQAKQRAEAAEREKAEDPKATTTEAATNAATSAGSAQAAAAGTENAAASQPSESKAEAGPKASSASGAEQTTAVSSTSATGQTPVTVVSQSSVTSEESSLFEHPDRKPNQTGREAYGHTPKTLPVVLQWGKEPTIAQAKLIERQASDRGITDPELLATMRMTLCEAFGRVSPADQKSMGANILLVEWLTNADDDSLEHLVAASKMRMPAHA